MICKMPVGTPRPNPILTWANYFTITCLRCGERKCCNPFKRLWVAMLTRAAVMVGWNMLGWRLDSRATKLDERWNTHYDPWEIV